MPKLRYSRADGEWVIVAGERSGRPHEYGGRPRPRRVPRRRADCDFCPGNEDRTPPSIFEWRAGRRRWDLRAFENKYAALTGAAEAADRSPGDRFFASREASGRHEVLVETPLHNGFPAVRDPAELARVVEAYRERFQSLRDEPGIAYVQVFKNHGMEAGTSLEHPHSQIAALTVVPVAAGRRFEIAAAERSRLGACVYCRTIEEEERDGSRIVGATDAFAVVCPFASRRAGEAWIIPRAHRPSFGDLSDGEIPALGDALGDLLRRMRYAWDDPDYNLVVVSAAAAGQAPDFHWYLRCIPRLARTAGLELGTGIFVNSRPPERAAEALRNSR